MKFYFLMFFSSNFALSENIKYIPIPRNFTFNMNSYESIKMKPIRVRDEMLGRSGSRNISFFSWPEKGT